jgi:glycine/D-amino acid oxidase-like deaminating enzyme
MHCEIQADIAVLGGGCAGLWLAHDFAKRGFQCVLVEHGPLGMYASQGNQSWLHSGALYAVIESEQQSSSPNTLGLSATTRECFKGYARLRRFARRHCKNAIDSRSECMFLYSDELKAERAYSVLTNYGMQPRIYTSRLDLLEPILIGSQAHIALVTKDLPFNAARILTAVSRRAARLGTRFLHSSQTLENLSIVKDGTDWVVKDEGFTIHASVVVCATGALVSKQYDRLRFISMEQPSIQKCIVGAFDTRLCNRVLVFRIPEAQWLNLVPFPGGTTINLGRRDEPTTDISDRSVPDNFFESLSDVLSFYAPGIARWRTPVRSHAYICQKVGNQTKSSRPLEQYGMRHYFWSEAQQPGLYFAYPGKFTLSANCSSALVQHIQRSGVLRKASTHARGPLGTLPRISDSPYHADPTHVLIHDRHGAMRFVPRFA